MYCSLCQKWKRRLPGRGNIWITAPCVVLRRKSLDHLESKPDSLCLLVLEVASSGRPFFVCGDSRLKGAALFEVILEKKNEQAKPRGN